MMANQVLDKIVRLLDADGETDRDPGIFLGRLSARRCSRSVEHHGDRGRPLSEAAGQQAQKTCPGLLKTAGAELPANHAHGVDKVVAVDDIRSGHDTCRVARPEVLRRAWMKSSAVWHALRSTSGRATRFVLFFD